MTFKIPAKKFNHLYPTNRRLLQVVLTFLVLLFLPLLVQSNEFQGCVNCHQTTLDRDSSRYYIHSPFSVQKCGGCHAAQTPPLAEETIATNSSSGHIDKRKINWLGDSVMADTDHGFILPGDKLGDTLVVEQHGNDGKFFHQEIDVPSLVKLAEAQDSGKPPIISDIQVLRVQRAVFLSATIGWHTDSLTDTHIRYGNKELSQTSQTSNRLGRLHEVVLRNLKPDETYHFIVTSNDLFGRSQTSEKLTFSTSRPFESQPDSAPGDHVKRDKEDGMAHRFHRLGTDYIFELALEQPAAVYVGSKGIVAKRGLSTQSPDPLLNNSDHVGLNSKQELTIKVCQSCHLNQTAVTHPVNVYPKPGMTIPPEYPTLPDGRITCRSCHEAHGSDYEFLAIVAGKRELCIGCHKDMI